MKTRAALALSVAGILVTGSAALAVNTQVLNTTPAGTGNANSILLPTNSGNSPAPAAIVGAKVTPRVTSTVGGGKTPPAAAKTAGTPKSGDDGGRRRTSSSTESRYVGDDRGGIVTKKSDAGTSTSRPTGDSTSQSDAGPAGSQPDGTVGSQPNASPAVVPVQAGDDKTGLRTAPQPGDDKGGQRKASQPGGDSGGHGSDD
ncbi:hypothetical protein ACFRAU_08840 [Arthrobacter sp. NPDC056691]|uniref:hypothetical protein n=1 Tax=Arthrobacter sp. NPDC056691 TaxID=3345913 RepID=UPI00367300D6